MFEYEDVIACGSDSKYFFRQAPDRIIHLPAQIIHVSFSSLSLIIPFFFFISIIIDGNESGGDGGGIGVEVEKLATAHIFV